MILNSFAVLLCFVALLRLLVGLLVTGAGVSLARRQLTIEQRDVLEDRSYLVFLLTLLLLVLNLISWPLLYLLLQSYVPEWPGVMCIYGVTQIGTNSMGTSRHLPNLLNVLQLSKPLLIFAGGAWFVLYLLNRRTATAALLPRLFLILPVVGLLAIGDALAELTYVAIPKKEEYISTGCCTEAFEQGAMERFLPQSYLGENGTRLLYGAYYGSNVVLILALLLASRREQIQPGGWTLLALLGWSLIVLTISTLFLVDVASPTLLQLPLHHCPYDLIPEVPEAMAAIGLFLTGMFSLGWAGVIHWLGRTPQTLSLLPSTVCRLLRLGAGCYLASLGMFSVELLLT